MAGEIALADIKIAVLNASTVLTDDQIKPAVDALQIQVHRDFAPAWGIDADLVFVPKGQTPPPGAWQIAVLNTSDQAGALGYHDLTADGLPIGKVFAGDDLDSGTSWSVTLSHELLEMLGDPDINLTVLVDLPHHKGRLYVYEACDAVEDDSLGYLINGILVSDFIFPSWFESFRQPNSTKFDFQGKLSAPFQLLPGGYIGVMNIRESAVGWTQITMRADTKEETIHRKADAAPVGSRRERRNLPRHHWKRSTAGK